MTQQLFHSWVFTPKKQKHADTKTFTQMFIGTLLLVAQNWKQSKCPGTEWTNQSRYTHSLEYYLAVKRNKLLPHATAWTNLKNIVLNENSQQESVRTVRSTLEKVRL